MTPIYRNLYWRDNGTVDVGHMTFDSLDDAGNEGRRNPGYLCTIKLSTVTKVEVA